MERRPTKPQTSPQHPAPSGPTKKVMTDQEFERLLDNDKPPTRITLSSDRRYQSISDDELSDTSIDRALASSAAFYDLVSNGQPNSNSNTAGFPQQVPKQGVYPGVLPSRKHPVRSNSNSTRGDPDSDTEQPKKRNETKALAEFLRSTGPDPMVDNNSTKKEKKKKKTGFFGFGKKKSNDEQSKSANNSGGNKHVKLEIPYDPFKSANGTPQQGQSQQQHEQQQPSNDYLTIPTHISNREVRRSIIIAEDEGRFGAPLVDVSNVTGRPRRPESMIRMGGMRGTIVGAGQGETYFGPPRQQSLVGLQRGGEQSQQQGQIMGQQGGEGVEMPYPTYPQGFQGQQQQRYEAPEGQKEMPSSNTQQQLKPKPPSPLENRLLPDEALRVSPFDPSFRFSDQRFLPISGIDPQNIITPSPLQQPPTTAHSLQREAEGNDYLLSDDDDDWDDPHMGGYDNDYDDEDEYDDFDDLDEETLKNTELNAMIDFGIADVVSTQPQIRHPSNNNEGKKKKNVSFSAVCEELMGAWVDSDGEFEYGPLSTGFVALRDRVEERERELEGVREVEEPRILSRGSSLGFQGVVPGQSQQQQAMQGQGQRGVQAQPPSDNQPKTLDANLSPEPTPRSAPPPPSSIPVDQLPSTTSVAQRSASLPPTTTTGTDPQQQQPTPPSTPQRTRKKVRHVQIQTRGAPTSTQSTQTSLTHTEIDNHVGDGTASSTSTPTTDWESKYTTLKSAHSQTLTTLTQTQSSLTASQTESQTLLQEVIRLRSLLTQMDTTHQSLLQQMESEKKRFEGLSLLAAKKIRELVVERSVLEVEVGSLKGQVEGLEKMHKEWVEQGAEGEVEQ